MPPLPLNILKVLSFSICQERSSQFEPVWIEETSHRFKIQSSLVQLFFGYWNSSLFSLTLKLCIILFQTSSQVAKLENTVETLRTVLTQKIQSEAQTVCSRTHHVGDLLILESTFDLSVFWSSKGRSFLAVLFFPVKTTTIVVFWWRVGEPKTFRLLLSNHKHYDDYRSGHGRLSSPAYVMILNNTTAEHHGLSQWLLTEFRPYFIRWRSLRCARRTGNRRCAREKSRETSLAKNVYSFWLAKKAASSLWLFGMWCTILSFDTLTVK